MSSLFGSTYIFEQLLSRMKHTKSKNITKISNEHLENSLRIATTSIEPDIEALVYQKQCQISHSFYVALFSFTFIMNIYIFLNNEFYYLDMYFIDSTFFFFWLISYRVFYVRPKTTRLFPIWPRKAKRLENPWSKISDRTCHQGPSPVLQC